MPVYRLRYVEDILQTRPARRQRCDRDARALRKRRPTIPTTQPIASPSHAACNELPDGMRGSPGVVRVETCEAGVHEGKLTDWPRREDHHPPNDVYPAAPAIGMRTSGRAKGQRERVRIACG